MKDYRSDFPLLHQNPGLVYLDSASTSQKPTIVIDAVNDVYTKRNANVQRSLYDLGVDATKQFESIRQKTAEFIDAEHANEIIFTSGATESANVIAEGWARRNLRRGDIVVTTAMEHHSNFVPWLRLKQEIGIKVHILPVDNAYRLQYAEEKLDYPNVRLLAITHVSNVLGTINPVSDIASFFRKRGAKNMLIFVDAAQSLPHLPVSVKKLQADFLAFSSHKMFGPAGTGVLYAAAHTHDALEPFKTGSHMVESVDFNQAIWAAAPDKFEAGTPNIEGVIGLGAALDYLTGVSYDELMSHDRQLTAYALERLHDVPDVTIYGPATTEDRLGIISFNLNNIHPHDVTEIANRSRVCLRAGHHCAMPLMQRLGINGTVRASTQLYNSRADIDSLIHSIHETKRIFNS